MTLEQRFQKGNLISLKLKNFKGVRDLAVEFTSGINFLIAPNGHGKSSILEAIALCLGSRSEDLNELVYEGEAQANVDLVVFDRPPSQISVVVKSDGQRIYSHNGSAVQCSYIQKLSRKYKIFVDNPFVSMMQHTAQKIMDVQSFDRLKYLLEISQNGDAEEYSVDVKELMHRCEACIDLFSQFSRKRNEFQKYSNDFRLVEESERLRRLIDQMEVHVYCDKVLALMNEQEGLRIEEQQAQQRERKAQQRYTRHNEAIGTISNKIDGLDKVKERQFAEFRALCTHVQAVEQSLRRYQQQLRQAMMQEKTLDDLSKSNNEERKKALEETVVRTTNEISQLTANKDRLRQQELKFQGEFDSESKTSLNTLHDAFLRVKDERNHYFSEIQQIQNDCYQYRNWFQACAQTQQDYEGRSFVIFPAIAHIAVNRLCPIPETEAKLILLQVFGNDIYTVYTQDFAVNALLSKRFGEFQAATSVQTLPRAYFGKTFGEAYEYAQGELEKVQSQKLQLRKLKPSDVVSCTSLLVGNPIVLHQNIGRLQQVYYIIHNANQDDAFMATEIDYIFQNNPRVSGVFYQNKYYRALKYDGHYNGKQITALDIQRVGKLFSLIRVQAPREFQHLPDIDRRYRQIEADFNRQEKVLNNAKEASRIKEAKISELRQQIQNIVGQISERNQALQVLQTQISQCRVVTAEEFQSCQQSLRTAREGISTCLLQIIDKSESALQMQVSCADIVIAFKELEVELENAKMAAQQAQAEVTAASERRYEVADKMAQITASLSSFTEQSAKYGIQLDQQSREHTLAQLQAQIGSTPAEVLAEFEKESQKSKQEVLDFQRKKLALQLNSQSVNIQDEQTKILELYTRLATEYAFIKQQAQAVFQRFEEVKSMLKQFIGQLNEQFMRNMRAFGVSGELQLKTWKSNETTFQKDYREIETQLQQTLPLEGLPQTPQELSALFIGFNFDFSVLAKILRNFAPGVNLNTKFAAAETLTSASLSGGEKSVASLCLACSVREIPLRIIDEINQGMDEGFENCAHEMIKNISGQVIVSSPKLSAKMDFGGVQNINIVVITRRPVD